MNPNEWLDLLIGGGISAAELALPAIVAIVTVPVFAGLKKLVAWLDKLPAWAQQVAAVFTAAALTQVGAWLNVLLPTDLTLITGDQTEMLLSGFGAWAIHAARKSREKKG